MQVQIFLSEKTLSNSAFVNLFQGRLLHDFDAAEHLVCVWIVTVWQTRVQTRLVQTCPDLSRLVQTCPDLSYDACKSHFFPIRLCIGKYFETVHQLQLWIRYEDSLYQEVKMHKFLCRSAKEFLLTKSRARLPFLSPPPAPNSSLESTYSI